VNWEGKRDETPEHHQEGPEGPGKLVLHTRSLASHVTINELYYHSSATNERDEYVILYNPTASSVNIEGWVLGDGEDEAEFPEGTGIASKDLLYCSRDAEAFNTLAGFKPDFEWDPTYGSYDTIDDPTVPNLIDASDGSGEVNNLKLSNTGDEVYLDDEYPDSDSTSVDVVVYESFDGSDLPEGSYSGTKAPTCSQGEALVRLSAGDEGTEADGEDADDSPENDEALASTFQTGEPLPEFRRLALPLLAILGLTLLKKRKQKKRN